MGLLFMKNSEKLRNWLIRAKSNLAVAKTGAISDEVLYEDLCFNAQQAAEKALKALCVGNNIIFPRTHDLSYLIDLLKNVNVSLPDELKSVRLLTDYAVVTRYPGEYEPITEKEYQDALEIVEKLITWVEQEISFRAD